jgi:hypothetical protein
MPPGPSKAVTEHVRGVTKPRSWLSQEQGLIARVLRERKSNVRGTSNSTVRKWPRSFQKLLFVPTARRLIAIAYRNGRRSP